MKEMPIATVIGVVLLSSQGLFAASAQAASRCDIRLEARGSYMFPDNTRVAGRRFGGLSGMDFEPRSQRMLFVSDERTGVDEAAVFVSAPVTVDKQGLDLGPLSLQPLRGLPADAGIDFEAMRMLPHRQGWLIASEGGADASVPPWFASFDGKGRLRWKSPLPAPLEQSPHNRSIESLAFDEAGDLWIALENALPGDGPQGDATRGAELRMARFRVEKDRPPVAIDSQQLYRTEPAEPDGAAGVSDIGISEMLIVGGTWWVMERSGTPSADGRYRFRSRLFCVEPARLSKTLLLDSRDELDPLEANLEAMTIIRRAGRPPLLVIANDNNFAPGVATRVLLFEILSR